MSTNGEELPFTPHASRRGSPLDVLEQADPTEHEDEAPSKIWAEHGPLHVGLQLYSVLAFVACITLWVITGNTLQNVPNQVNNAAEAQAEITARYPGVVLRPAAMRLTSLNFNSRYEISIVGEMWVYYPSGIDPSQNAYLPRFTQGRSYLTGTFAGTTATDRFYGSGSQVATYTFSGQVFNKMDYRAFPLDSHFIEIAVVPNGGSVIKESYIPSFDDYSGLPSNDDAFLLTAAAYDLVGYTTEKTEWSYRYTWFYTNQGQAEFTATFPALQFNVHIRRLSFSASIVDWVVLAILLWMTFLVVRISSGKKTKDKEFEKNLYSLTGFIGALSAVLFIIVSSHQTLRADFPNQFTLLDWYYAGVYILLLLIAICGYFYHTRGSKSFIRKTHLMPLEILYWPSVVSYLLAIAIYVYVGLKNGGTSD